MSNPESSPKSASVSDLPDDNHDSAVSACTSHHGDCLGNQLLGFVCGDDESNQTSTIGSSLLSRKRKDMTGQSEELEDIRVNVKVRTDARIDYSLLYIHEHLSLCFCYETGISSHTAKYFQEESHADILTYPEIELSGGLGGVLPIFIFNPPVSFQKP